MVGVEKIGSKKVKEIVGNRGVDGILIFTPESIRYLTGFSGGEGCFLAGVDGGSLMVDGRYITQAQEEAHSCRSVLVEKGIRGVAAHISTLGLRRLGFEPEGISVANFGLLQEQMNEIELVPMREELERIRGIKTDEEIIWIRGAIKKAEDAWKSVMEMVKPGVREDELALELEYRMRREGSEGVAFETIVASGPRSALPHARPSTRKFESGDILTIDFGSRYQGYSSDETLTIVIGQASAQQRRIYQIVQEAHDKAIERVRPGVKLSEVDTAARTHISEAGYGEHFVHGTGHGVGLAVHEWPVVGKDSQTLAEEGIVFTIEPGIYIPDWGGVRIEDMILVTADGAEILTRIPKDLTIVS